MNTETLSPAQSADQVPVPEPDSTPVQATGLFEKTKYKVLGAVSASHFLNDATQSLLVPTYPMLKSNFSLSFTQIGLITLTYQITASLLQPMVGFYTDKRPQPYSLPVGMSFSLVGLMILAFAPAYHWLLLGAALVGIGSSVFHPESSRVARMAAGGQFGLAQSVFQVGGNAGSSVGPLMAAAVIIPNGQWSLSWFAVLPITGIIILLQVSKWASGQRRKAKTLAVAPQKAPLPRKTVVRTLAVLLALVFSKYFYMASITSYFIFYLIHKFGISVQSAQLHLFIFLFAVAAGTILGGPVGDRIGRKYVIWVSILGVTPFTLALPYMDLFWTSILIFIIGFILASAFSAIVVFAQELMPGHVGMVAGLFFGLSFGLGGVGAAVLGNLADSHGIEFVYRLCSYLPLFGLLAIFLPNLREKKRV